MSEDAWIDQLEEMNAKDRERQEDEVRERERRDEEVRRYEEARSGRGRVGWAFLDE